MRNMLFALTGVVALAVAGPAAAQVHAGDEGGVGVRIGPLGVGVGPDYGWRHRHGYRDYDGYDGYAAGSCRVIRTKTVRPSGRVVYRTKRVCD